jgi:hypothetical protein
VTGYDIDLGADGRSPAGRNAAALTALTVQQARSAGRLVGWSARRSAASR